MIHFNPLPLRGDRRYVAARKNARHLHFNPLPLRGDRHKWVEMDRLKFDFNALPLRGDRP